jgi:hypothetical protein
VWTRDSVWCLQEARYYFPPSIQTLSKEQAATYSTSTLCFPPGVNRLEHEATINLHPGPKLRLTDDITHALPMTSVSTRGKLTFFILGQVYHSRHFIMHVHAVISRVLQTKKLPTPQPHLVTTAYWSMKLITHLHPVPKLRKHDTFSFPYIVLWQAQ